MVRLLRGLLHLQLRLGDFFLGVVAGLGGLLRHIRLSLRLNLLHTRLGLELRLLLLSLGIKLGLLEVYLALQQGTIDGAENPLSSGTDQKWPEVVKFVTLTKHQATGQSFQVNERWYQGLTPDLRKVVEESCLESSEFLAGLMVEHDVGVSKTQTYEVKKVDSDYFLEE